MIGKFNIVIVNDAKDANQRTELCLTGGRAINVN